jgi:integrase
LPLSDYLLELLTARKDLCAGSSYVFPGDGKRGHIAEPKRLVHTVGDRIGQHFTVHDLRRTYITVAESLNISQYSLKALVNHRHPDDDITGSYIQLTAERLREPMQLISDFVLESAGIRTMTKRH